MTQNITPPDDSNEDNQIIGLDHVTVNVDTEAPSPFNTTGEIHYPDDERPDYEIISATDPRNEFPTLAATRLGRLELTDRGEIDGFDHETVFDAIGAAHDQYHDEYGEHGCVVERVYIRKYAGEEALCIHLRAHLDEMAERSRLLLAIDEKLREAFFDE